MMLAWVEVAQLFEAGMLVCFGFSWPVAIVKTLRAKRVAGKSFWFLVLVFVGYLCGIAAKLAFARASGEPLPWVTLLYALNAAMVATDAALYRHYSRRERAGFARGFPVRPAGAVRGDPAAAAGTTAPGRAD